MSIDNADLANIFVAQNSNFNQTVVFTYGVNLNGNVVVSNVVSQIVLLTNPTIYTTASVFIIADSSYYKLSTNTSGDGFSVLQSGLYIVTFTLTPYDGSILNGTMLNYYF